MGPEEARNGTAGNAKCASLLGPARVQQMAVELIAGDRWSRK